MSHRFCQIAALLAVAMCFGTTASAWADIYILTSGGQVHGELLNPTESPRKQFIIRTEQGATVTVDRAQLKQIVPQSPAETEYEKIRPTFADTAEGQWQLAEWCVKNSLSKQRNAAMERVIELDPDHKQARMGLGYSFLNGKWMRRDEWRKANGYVLYKGDWKLPQEIDLIENRRQTELAEKKWFLEIRKWRAWLNDSAKAKEAEEKLKSIDDPAAVAALSKVLNEGDGRPLRMLYVRALGRIYTPDAIKTLVAHSLDDADVEIRLSCLDELAAKPHPDITSKYVPVLRDKNNTRVNRAALAIGKMGDKTTIRPLIDALVTTHSFSVTSGNSNPNGISTAFGSDGSGGLSMGSSTRIIKRDMQNQAVLDALVNLTGLSLDFDEVAWRNWYAAQNKAAKVNPRRD
jgi:hypothetical protein